VSPDISVPAANGLAAYDIGHAVEAEVSIPANLQHDPELASRGSVAGGGDDQTKFFGKPIAKAASRSTEESARGTDLRSRFPVKPETFTSLLCRERRCCLRCES